MATTRKLGNIDVGKTVFFLCDMQEKFKPAIKYFSEILEVSVKLVEVTKILNIPLIVTEQYPKGLGSTVSELDVSQGHVFPKTKFSMFIEPVEAKLSELCNGQVEHIVLFGIETHVCVQQTVIDLLSKGYEVHVVADGTSSRTQMDRKFALERFRFSGATVTTSDALLLQLVGDKDHQHFKAVQKLIMKTAPDSGL